MTDSLYEAAVPSTYMPMRTSNAYKGIAEQVYIYIILEVRAACILELSVEMRKILSISISFYCFDVTLFKL